MKKKKRKILLITAAAILAVGIIVYKLADRYLIEHVAVENALTGTETTASATATTTGASTTAIAKTTATTSTEEYEADEWNYESATKSINITKVETGTEDNPILYYVADVELKEGTSILSAFANNQFGNNITANTSEIASENDAIFAINGDYYGFRSDGITIRNGQVFRDEGIRTGLAFYADGTMKTYDETETDAETLVSEGVTQTLSFGPVLVENSEAVEEFGNVSIDKNFGNRSIDEANPRTGVGIISANHYVFVVVDGRNDSYSNGMTLEQFAQVFEELGCTDAYNLDGGGSSTMYFMGNVVNYPQGKDEERGVSDILYVK